jgi:hypothetical protein
MFRIVIVVLLSGVVILSCQKGKRVTPPQKAPDEITEFQPTVQGKDYINEEGSRSFVPESGDAQVEVRKIKDGTYIADVEYFNTSTGANVTYVTKVQVENGYLKVIKWPNGVWLTSSYFNPEKIRQDGTCIVRNIEAGYENRVRILNLEYY